jgi:hypothetical protein
VSYKRLTNRASKSVWNRKASLDRISPFNIPIFAVVLFCAEGATSLQAAFLFSTFPSLALSFCRAATRRVSTAFQYSHLCRGSLYAEGATRLHFSFQHSRPWPSPFVEREGRHETRFNRVSIFPSQPWFSFCACNNSRLPRASLALSFTTCHSCDIWRRRAAW